MAERTISVPVYVTVCVALVVLTVLTVGISFFPLRSFWHVVIGLSIGLVKASLVVLFFMHALISSNQTRLVIVVAVFWLGIMLALMYTDYFSRDLIPYAPGH